LKSVALAIDGTEIRIGRPGVDERTRYSAKKKQHAINVLVLVSLTGKFVAISDPQDGLPNDQGLWKATGWRKSASRFAPFFLYRFALSFPDGRELFFFLFFSF
jgi:hypothetical protein